MLKLNPAHITVWNSSLHRNISISCSLLACTTVTSKRQKESSKILNLFYVHSINPLLALYTVQRCNENSLLSSQLPLELKSIHPVVATRRRGYRVSPEDVPILRSTISWIHLRNAKTVLQSNSWKWFYSSPKINFHVESSWMIRLNEKAACHFGCSSFIVVCSSVPLQWQLVLSCLRWHPINANCVKNQFHLHRCSPRHPVQ